MHAVEAAWAEGPELVAAVNSEVTDASHLRIALARGHGVLLAGDGSPFHDLPIARADAASVAEWLERTRPRRASLDVGELSLRPGVRFGLDAGGFDRHVLFCGQSGSGKTYALGTILEQLLLQTSLRLVILDPNSASSGSASPETALTQAWHPAIGRRQKVLSCAPSAAVQSGSTSAFATSTRSSRPPYSGSIPSGTVTSTVRSSRFSRAD